MSGIDNRKPAGGNPRHLQFSQRITGERSMKTRLLITVLLGFLFAAPPWRKSTRQPFAKAKMPSST